MCLYKKVYIFQDFPGFVLTSRHLSVCNRLKSLLFLLQDALTVVVEDLRLCSVKPCEDIERRFCFEVVSPTKYVYFYIVGQRFPAYGLCKKIYIQFLFYEFCSIESGQMFVNL